MPSGSRSTVVDVTYADPRTGERIRERRIQEIPDDEIEDVRRREMAMVLAPSREEQDMYYDRARDYDPYSTDPRGRRKNDFLAVDQYRAPRARSYRGEKPRRRRSPSSSSRGSSDSEDDRRSSRRHRDRRRARSAQPGIERDPKADDDEGILWYSGKPRKDCNFLERNFDSSYDGLLTAAAGAAIGAMTARRFAHKDGDEKKRLNWKTWGGAVVGAGLFNVAENHYRVYTEEKIERKAEERVERRRRDS